MELPFIMAQAVCHVEGCFNENAVIESEVGLPLDSDEPFVICGPCGQQITDITPLGEKYTRIIN